MIGLFSAEFPWMPFLGFLVAFGVMPGIVLRVIVRAHPRESGRRRELIAELYAIPPLRRPLWVAEQLELALTEGLVQRLWHSPDWIARRALRLVFRSQAVLESMTEALPGIPRWYRPWWAIREGLDALRFGSHRLESGIVMNAKYPESFWIPDPVTKAEIVPGDSVKLCFRTRDDDWGERMWVHVNRVRGGKLTGTLSNVPIGLPRIGAGDRVKFTLDHVIDIDFDG